MRRSVSHSAALVAAAALVSCAAEEAAWPPAAVSLVPASATSYEVRVAQRAVSAVPVQHVNLDRVEADVHAGSGRVAFVVLHGEHGGATLWIEHEPGVRRRVLEVQHPESLSRPVWSTDGERLAVVRLLPPSWRDHGAGRQLQYAGELWLADAAGAWQRVPGLTDAARVLGWIGDRSLLVTRFAPGDLPQEGLARVELQRGVVQDLLPNDGTANIYGLTLLGGDRVAYARTRRPVVTMPDADDEPQLTLVDLEGVVRQVLPLPAGRLPAALSLEDGALSYREEGTGQAWRVKLADLEGAAGAPPPEREALPPDAVRWQPTLPPVQLFAATTKLPMPYLHQRYDTPNDFNGSWACGPTSTVMAIQHFNRLDPKPITVDVPSSHKSDFGVYVARKYTAYGHTFDRTQNDPNGRPAAGAYGWCTEGGGAWAWRMQDYAKKHDLKSDFFDAATFAAVKKDIDAGRPVALSTRLTSAGHIIAIKGYTADGKLIANDPWGNKTLGTYPNATGGDATYAWSYVSAKWNINVSGEIRQIEPAYRAQVVSVKSPPQITAGTAASAVIVLKNTGTAAWNGKTRLGTTKPRDRESVLCAADAWLSPSRVGAVPATEPGARATIEVPLLAPAVDEPTTLTECFNLVQEGNTWFSADGGPKDDAICLTVEVLPVTVSLAPAPTDPPAEVPEASPGSVLRGPRVAQGGCAVAQAPDAAGASAGAILVGLLVVAMGRRRRRWGVDPGDRRLSERITRFGTGARRLSQVKSDS